MLKSLIHHEKILEKVYNIKGEKVMLDKDLATLYGVETKYLNKAVKRNIERFPSDFMFQLSEKDVLRFQIGTSKNKGSGGRRYIPYVFTEQGISMLSSVLKSKQAIEVNIIIMRTFVQIRKWAINYKALSDKIEEIKFEHGSKINYILKTLNELIKEEETKKNEIGFK